MSDSTAVRGRVHVIFYSADQKYVDKSAKRFCTVFNSSKVKVSIRGVKLLETECSYTMETEIYPLLQEIYSERTSAEDLIAAAALFEANFYSEKIVLYKDTDYFDYAPIREIKDEEKKEIEYSSFRYRRKLLNSFYAAEKAKNDKSIFAGCSYHEAVKFGNEMRTCETYSSQAIESAGDVKSSTAAEFAAFLIMKKTFFLNNSYEDYSSPGKYSLYWGSPNPEGKEYVESRSGRVFCYEGIQPENSLPLYSSFEQFFFWPDDSIEKFFHTGWCIRAGEKLWALTNPFETVEEEVDRAIRDKGCDTFRKEYFPMLWGEPKPFEFKHEKAKKEFHEVAAYHGSKVFANTFHIRKKDI